MPELQRLGPDHASAVLRFELDNRAYFMASISDRGDEYFEQFTERHDALLCDQDVGVGAYYLLVEPNGEVVGRFNLTFTKGGVATLGYRVAQSESGRGLATMAVRDLCGLAAATHGCRRIVAATSKENVASQKVLTKAGFTRSGAADPAEVGGKSGYRYERILESD